MLNKDILKKMIDELINFVSEFESPYNMVVFEKLLNYYIENPEKLNFLVNDDKIMIGSRIFELITPNTKEHDAIMLAIKYIEEELGKKGALSSEIKKVLWEYRNLKISNISARLSDLVNKGLLVREKNKNKKYIFMRTLKGIEYTDHLMSNS